MYDLGQHFPYFLILFVLAIAVIFVAVSDFGISIRLKQHIGASEPDESQTLETVRSYHQPAQAMLAKSVLEGNGVKCVLLDEHTVNINMLYAPALGGIKLAVPADQVDIANEILLAYNNQAFENQDEPAVEEKSVN